MLSITRISSGQASSYYSKDDYYLDNNGQWQGRGAEVLGLGKTINEKDFISLTKGVGVNNEFKISSGGADYKHTAGVDLTFSAPKSVSIASLVLGDGRILELHNRAVIRTLNYIEDNLAKVRLKVSGRVLAEKTDNLIIAKFQHVSSRELDPQLHTHCVVFNASQKMDKNWRAVDYKGIFDNKKMLGQIYRNELAKGLKEIGYEIKADNKGLFELANIDSKLIKEFSVRSEQIKLELDELRNKLPNANEAKLKAIATINSRKVKDEPSLEELKAQWEERLNKYELNKLVVSNDLASALLDKADINELVYKAVEFCVVTEAVVSKEEILKVAMENNVGNYSVAELEVALINHVGLKNYNNSHFTTKELAAIETQIINNTKEQQGTQLALFEVEKIEQEIIRYEMEKGFKLSLDQKNGIIHILNSTDRIIAIQGDAGTGKTTMIDCVNTIINREKIDLTLNGLAYTGKAAYELEKSSNVVSQTIASFLHKKEGENKSCMYIVDEASMLSIKNMDDMLNKIDDNSRIVLIGDSKQLQSIGAGKIFTTLQDEKAINSVVLKDSKRQTEQIYKEATGHMANRLTNKAFDMLNDNGKIIEVYNKEERLSIISNQYCADYKNTLLVTATNKDRVELINKIRDILHESGKISNSVVELQVREVKNLNDNEKTYSNNYAINDIVIFNGPDKAGVEGGIIAINDSNNTITLKDKTNSLHEIDLTEYGKSLLVYKEKLNKITAGEKIIFLKNDKSLQVNNGQTAIVKSITADGRARLMMENGKERIINLRTQYKYVDYGYAITDYKSQGQTAKNVIYNADTSLANYNQAYVGISRGKDNITIYTDNKDKLKQQIGLEKEKTTIIEFEKAMMQQEKAVEYEYSNGF